MTAAGPRHEWTAVPLLGVPVHARVWDGPADQPPIVLVAGLGVSSLYWTRLGRRLACGRTVLAADLPGFGRTPPVPGTPWPGGPSVPEQADQLLAWLDARGVGRAVLCGHSVGCQTVVEFAARRPDRVERLVLMAPPFEPGRRSLAVSLPRLAVGAWFEVPSLLLWLAVEYASAGAPRAVQQAHRSMSFPMERVLPRVTVPTLVVHGQRDPLVSRRWASTVAALVPAAMLVEVERVGHAMHYSAAAVTAEVVGRFIRGELDRPMTGGTTVAGVDDGRSTAPQPLSPRWHRLLDGVAAALGVAPSAAVVSVANGLATDFDTVDADRLPMVTHAAVDLACAAALLWAGSRRRRQRRALWALAAYHLLTAVLTAKPTGPAVVAARAGAGEPA